MRINSLRPVRAGSVLLSGLYFATSLGGGIAAAAEPGPPGHAQNEHAQNEQAQSGQAQTGQGQTQSGQTQSGQNDQAQHDANSGGVTEPVGNPVAPSPTVTDTESPNATTNRGDDAVVTVDRVDDGCDSVLVTSTKDISNVVVVFGGGDTLKFDNLSGLEWSYTDPQGRAIVGAWVKSGNNKSGDGPGFGELVTLDSCTVQPDDGTTNGGGSSGASGGSTDGTGASQDGTTSGTTAGEETTNRGDDAVITVEPLDDDCTGVTVTSTKDISNVVLLYADGTEEKHDGLSGTTWTYEDADGRVIIGAWVKSGNNKSGDGPGYGTEFLLTDQCSVPADDTGGDNGTGGDTGSGDTGSGGTGGDNGTGGDTGSGDTGSGGTGGETNPGDDPDDPDTPGDEGDSGNGGDAGETVDDEPAGDDTPSSPSGDTPAADVAEAPQPTQPEIAPEAPAEDAPETVVFVAVEDPAPVQDEAPAPEADDDTEVLGIVIDNPDTSPDVTTTNPDPQTTSTPEVSPQTLPRTGASTLTLGLVALGSLGAGGSLLRRTRES